MIMPLSGNYRLGDVSVVVWSITENEDELLSQLPLEYVTVVQSMKSERRRMEWLAVRMLLSHLFGHEERIIYDEAGKPTLVKGEYNISISHTTGYAVLAYSDKPFGIDVELLDRDLLPLARKLLGDAEMALLDKWCVNELLLARWCACESLFKLVGDLGGTFKDNVIVRLSSLSDSGTFEVLLSGVTSFYGERFVANYRRCGDVLLVACTPVEE